MPFIGMTPTENIIYEKKAYNLVIVACSDKRIVGVIPNKVLSRQ